jgi:hypothetical protein
MKDKKEIIDWVRGTGKDLDLDDGEIEHVALCLDHIQKHCYEGRPLGGFLSAVVRNDFIDACCRADKTNIKCLRLYAWFMWNEIPFDRLYPTRRKLCSEKRR